MKPLIGGTGGGRSLDAKVWVGRSTWVSALAWLVLLLAGAHGLAALPTPWGGWVVPGPPAPELRGPLALNFALLALAGLAVDAGPAGAAWARGLRGASLLSALLLATALLAGWPAALPFGPLTTAGLLVAAAVLAALLWLPARPHADAVVVASQLGLALVWALLAACVCLLVPAWLLLDALPLAGGLSWPGTLCLGGLAVLATRRLRRHPALHSFLADREDRRIFSAHLAMLFGATMLATLLIAAVLAVRSVEDLSAPLQRRVEAQAGALDQWLQRLAEAGARAAQAWPATADNPTQAAALLALHQQLEVLGQVGVALDVQGETVQTAGLLLPGPWLRLPPRGVQSLALASQDGLLLQLQQPLPQRPGQVLRVQLRPLQLQVPWLPAELGGGSAARLLCVPEGPDAACLSTDGQPGLRMPLPPRADGSLWPIQQAWRGQRGVLRVRDPWQAAAVVAFAPVGHTGLGLVHKLPLAPLLQRLVDAALPALLAVLAVIASGAALQVRRSFPRLRTLRHAKALLELVMQSLPVGVWVADRSGRVVSVNPAVEQLWRGPPPLADGRPVGGRTRRLADGSVIGPDDYPLLRAIRSGQPSINELIEIEHADGSRRTLMNSAVPLVDAAGRIQGAISVCEDLTAIRRAEAAIVAAQQVFESLFQSTAVGMAVWDAQGRFERVNGALCELLGFDEAGLRATPLAALGEPEATTADLAALGRMQRGELAKIEVQRRWRRADGRWVWVLLVVSVLRLPEAEQPQFVAQVLDIDRQRQAQQALEASQARLRALSANEEALIEEERRHIAREVHDELGQSLTALKMAMAMLQRQFGGYAALNEPLDRMAEMVDGTLDVVRHVASNLRPAALDFGLAAAIDWLAEDFGHRWELPCELQLDDGDVVLSDAQSMALFRIVQESLTNIARHAQARHVQISLRRVGARLRLRVQDDGIGFDTAQEPGGRFGLLGMRERALKIGARLQILSRPGLGTTIELELELPPDPDQPAGKP